jgi:hypothetical protein
MLMMSIQLMWNTLNKKEFCLLKLSCNFDNLLQEEIYVYELYNHVKAMLYYVDHQEI